MPLDRSYSVRARWALTPDRPAIGDARVSVADGKIASIGPAAGRRADFDLGDAILLPGFVNPHTHLEFSDLATPLGSPGLDFPDWIRLVLGYRNPPGETPTVAGTPSVDRRDAAVRQGWSESNAAGVWSAGEICPAPFLPRVYEENGFRGVVFHERLGLAETRSAEVAAELSATLDAKPRGGRFSHGVSPHAPYSVHWNLFEELVRLACERRLPLAMHLGESELEIEFLARRRGPFRDLLEELGVWNPRAWPAGVRLVDYLQKLAMAPRTLVIHGNLLGPDELDVLQKHRDRFCVVYCPRTHAYFQHPPYPLAALQAKGIPVAVATDSRASNPDLSVGRELQSVASQFPGISPASLLGMATSIAAWGMGLEGQFGRLETGAQACLSWVPIPKGISPADPWSIFVGELGRCQRWDPRCLEGCGSAALPSDA